MDRDGPPRTKGTSLKGDRSAHSIDQLKQELETTTAGAPDDYRKPALAAQKNDSLRRPVGQRQARKRHGARALEAWSYHPSDGGDQYNDLSLETETLGQLQNIKIRCELASCRRR